MNPALKRLYEMGSVKERIIIGLMSGTSLDGLDVALCRFRGSGADTSGELLEFSTIEYTQAFKNQVREVFARRQVDLQRLCMLHPWIGLQHAEMVLDCLSEWGMKSGEIDLIASHGQTVFHAPRWMHGDERFGASTLQLGDADQIAVKTGIITISDFRQKHIAAGGEGAPLAVYGDYLLFSDPVENRILLNIGGIANYTFLPAGGDADQVYASDTGPGNTLIDTATRKFFHQPFDEDGRIAGQGIVNKVLLTALKDHPFFTAPVPKTTGPELFNLSYVEEMVQQSGQEQLPPADLIATLTAFSAGVIGESLQSLVKTHKHAAVYLSGGGTKNPVLVEQIRHSLPGCHFDTMQALGMDPDAKEAVLFAALANETVAGERAVFAGNQSGIPAVSMGKISFPG